VFKGTPERPYNLNICGLRHPNRDADSFNDLIVVFWGWPGAWSIFAAPATTDPGTYWRQNPGRVEGVGILAEGRYPGLWGIGQHRRSYTALVQVAPCTLHRDPNRDQTLDFEGSTQTGLFGINLHRAGTNSQAVGKWSAGCQVVAKSADFEVIMRLAHLQIPQYGGRFSYCLFGPQDFDLLRPVWAAVWPDLA
jgi:hypothetical protein